MFTWKMHLLDITCLPHFNRVTTSSFTFHIINYYPTRSDQWTLENFCDLSRQKMCVYIYVYFPRLKIRQTNAQMPTYVPTLWCSSSYLLSSEQLAGNISPTSGAKHLSLGGGHRALVFQNANLAHFGDTSAPVWLGGMSVLFACHHTPDITY